MSINRFEVQNPESKYIQTQIARMTAGKGQPVKNIPSGGDGAVGFETLFQDGTNVHMWQFPGDDGRSPEFKDRALATVSVPKPGETDIYLMTEFDTYGSAEGLWQPGKDAPVDHRISKVVRECTGAQGQSCGFPISREVVDIATDQIVFVDNAPRAPEQ